MTAQDLNREFEEEFWPNVPYTPEIGSHKLDKGHARTAYARARKKASKEDIVYAGLPKYLAVEVARYRRSNGKFRPLHPATWLNGERWTDEVTIPGRRQSMPLCACGCGREAKKANEYKGQFYHTVECYWKKKTQ